MVQKRDVILFNIGIKQMPISNCKLVKMVYGKMPLPSALVTAIGSIDYRQNDLQSQAAGSRKKINYG